MIVTSDMAKAGAITRRLGLHIDFWLTAKTHATCAAQEKALDNDFRELSRLLGYELKETSQ